MELATSIFNKLSEALGNPHITNEVPSADYRRLSPIAQNGQLKLYEFDSFLDCILVHPTRADMFLRMFRMAKSQSAAAKSAFRCLSSHLPDFYSNFTSWYTANRLTNLSDIIRKYDDWSSVHIAVQAGLSEVLTKEQVGHMINNQFCEKSKSPMHLACELNQLDILEKCVLIGGSLSLQDENGNTALHYAARKYSNQFTGSQALKIIKFLCEKMTSDELDIQNSDGETALHVAIKEKIFIVAKMIIEAGGSIEKCSNVGFPIHYALKYADSQFVTYLLQRFPDQVEFVCKKHNSLPIHWCRTAEDVSLLVANGSKVSFTSMTSDTPLHVMVLKDRLDAAIGLIFQHADINVRGKDGNTPLHLAILNDNKVLVKMLLLFGADCQAKNDLDQTPGYFALRNSKPNRDEIFELLSNVGGIFLGDDIEKKVSEKVIESNGRYSEPESESTLSKAKVLCLDGGGIRGLILTQILIAIEEETGKKSKDLFDWICGTSTGGLLALALCLGNRAVDCQSIYFRLKDDVFTGPRPYDSAPMENFLKKIFGETTTLSQLPSHPKVVVTSVLADQRPAKLHLFRNYESVKEFFGPASSEKRPLQKVESRTVEEILASPMDTPLWQVARSSGAAPTYFRPMGNFVDGGLMSNNPTLDILTEIHLQNMALRQANRTEDIQPVGLVVSLGTGKVPSVKVKSVDLTPSANPLVLVSSAMAGIELTQIMIDAACECNGHIHDRVTAWCDSLNAPYYRLTPQLKEDIAMNEVTDEKLVDMLWTTKLYIQKNKHLIQEIAHLLLNEH